MEQLNSNILDITKLNQGNKYPFILGKFDNLATHESLVIKNDHDPKQLHSRMMKDRSDLLRWEYLEQGPEWWLVSLTKKQLIETTKTLGEIAVSNPGAIEIFNKYGLDFCCGGKMTLVRACAEKGINLAQVEQELQIIVEEKTYISEQYHEWKLDFLIDYIINKHHTYVRKTLPELRTYSAKVAEVHGNVNKELVSIQRLVFRLYDEMFSHMMKEEQILFPYIKELVGSENQVTSNGSSCFGSIQNPINMMEVEHDLAGGVLAEIRKLTGNYSLPESACTTYTLLFKTLQEFESDLHMHIHLENNILFPKAIELEEQKNSWQ